MSGNMFSNTSPITLEELRRSWPHLYTELLLVGFDTIVEVGTTWKKPVMGDVDLAASTRYDMDHLLSNMKTTFGDENVKRGAGNLISCARPLVLGRQTQVDIFVGDVTYLSWSRFGPSTEQLHPHFSRVKGIVRNVFLNTFLRETTSFYFDDLNRARDIIDFDKGLVTVRQTKSGQEGRQLKRWKTQCSMFLMTKPDIIVEKIFGVGNSQFALTFEGCLALAREEKRCALAPLRSKFVADLQEILATNPVALGDDPEGTIEFVRDLCQWNE